MSATGTSCSSRSPTSPRARKPRRTWSSSASTTPSRSCKNRSFYIDEINRLERKGPFPVTAIAVDVNGLKAVNDQLGHAAGDALLRRAGEVLGKAVEKPFQAARIGGDEFVLLLPGTDERGGEAVMAGIRQLVEVNNQFYSGMPLSFAMGAATAQDGERLEAMLQRADAVMYTEKRAHYGDPSDERRADPL